MSHLCGKTYTKMMEVDDAVNGRVQAFPDIRQANYLGTFQITPNYPELPTKSTRITFRTHFNSHSFLSESDRYE